jgi:colanic acid/amylovoran biosynthesis protein
VRACAELAASHPGVKLAPVFRCPVEAKSYIAKMDLFIGSRMHATIASFSSGIATVPAAYSRKFIGFFGNLGYDHVVDLTILDTAGAVSQTLSYVEHRGRLKDAVRAGNELARTRVRVFTDGLSALIRGCSLAAWADEPLRLGTP